MATMRPLTANETSHVNGALLKLREHFKAWPTRPGKEWYLVDFAYYEGCGHRDECCVGILKECAPLALGETLVHDHGFEWCMVGSQGSWRISVSHSDLAEPIDLHELDINPLLHPDHHDEDTEAFDPGQGAHESIHAILKKLGQTVAYD